MTDDQVITSGRRVLRMETDALAGVEQRPGDASRAPSRSSCARRGGSS